MEGQWRIRFAHASLSDMTNLTRAKDAAEVDKIAHQVARDIRNQYTIGYSSSNTNLDGTFRKIEIKVNAPGNPKVRTRSGYYATQDQASGKGAASK